MDDEFTREEEARLDELTNAAYDIAKLFTQEENLEYSASYVYDIIEAVEDIMTIRGYDVWVPSRTIMPEEVITNED